MWPYNLFFELNIDPNTQSQVIILKKVISFKLKALKG